jgi:nucleotide-binding universal stress UspA family protein
MEDQEKLKRLGGGRWESNDGRFTVEPQSGTWVIVDGTQTDELGLPLVRGPYPSLTAAREAIAEARQTGPPKSPLADSIERSRTRAKEQPPKPKPPPEPAWLQKLTEPDRRRVRALVKRLEAAGIPDAEAIARSEIADEQPALARLALERRLAEAQKAKDPRKAVREVLDAFLEGHDEATGARWQLLDGSGREIHRVDLP